MQRIWLIIWWSITIRTIVQQLKWILFKELYINPSLTNFPIPKKLNFEFWISQLQCCGADGPSDWENIFDNLVTYDPFAFVTGSVSTEPTKYQTPASCCDLSKYSSYEQNTCDAYNQKGCTLEVSNLAAETVLIIASVLLAIGAFQVYENISNMVHHFNINCIFQILGMFSSFMLARMFRQASTYRNVQKFSSQYGKVFDVPTYVDYERLHNTNDDANWN